VQHQMQAYRNEGHLRTVSLPALSQVEGGVYGLAIGEGEE